MKTLKQLWKNHKKALSDEFSYTIDDTIATEVEGGSLTYLAHPTDVKLFNWTNKKKLYVETRGFHGNQ